MTHIEKNDGKSFGPITGGVISVGTIVTLILAIGTMFGVDIPAEVATSAVTLLAGAIAWYTKGRVEVREEPATAVAAPLQSDSEPEPQVEDEPKAVVEADPKTTAADAWVTLKNYV